MVCIFKNCTNSAKSFEYSGIFLHFLVGKRNFDDNTLKQKFDLHPVEQRVNMPYALVCIHGKWTMDLNIFGFLVPCQILNRSQVLVSMFHIFFTLLRRNVSIFSSTISVSYLFRISVCISCFVAQNTVYFSYTI